MVLATIRAVADALSNPTYGLAVQLPLVDYDGADTAPSAPSIIDQTRNIDAALGRYNDQDNTVSVFLGEGVEMDGEVRQYYRDGSVPIICRYIRSEAQAEENTSAVFYMLQAIERALRVWLSSTTESDRVRSHIMIKSCESLTHEVVTAEQDTVLQVGMIKAVFAVRDINA